MVPLTRYRPQAVPNRPRAAGHATVRRLGRARAVHWVATDHPSGRRRGDKDGGGESRRRCQCNARRRGGPVPDRTAARDQRTPCTAWRASERGSNFDKLHINTATPPIGPVALAPRGGRARCRAWTAEAPAACGTRVDRPRIPRPIPRARRAKKPRGARRCVTGARRASLPSARRFRRPQTDPLDAAAGFVGERTRGFVCARQEP